MAVELRPDPACVEASPAERDRRQAADIRTDAEKWLGDPEPERSALRRKIR
jgi:hypothetical protein